MKQRSQFSCNVSPEAYQSLLAELSQVWTLFPQLQIAVPDWALMALAFLPVGRRECVQVSFYEDAKDFFRRYSAVLMRQTALKTTSFTKNPANRQWGRFWPPTLTGVELKTRLRQ